MTYWNSNFDRQDFLQNYWQKRPLLIRNALIDFEHPLDADELAGLALEDDIESRIIEQSSGKWILSHGPFHENSFAREPPWTLLVQAVDHVLPDVAQLRKLVDFIPAWRVDDVMISYATDGGGVGPHYDNYDVFLLQGSGERVWSLGQQCDESSPLVDHDELRILSDFKTVQEYTLSAGDILYVPPGVAHRGVAKGDCITYSIGFRAPRVTELLSRFTDAALEKIDTDSFYTDPQISSNARAGEISSHSIQSAKDQLLAALTAQTDDRWFGELVTEPKYDTEMSAAPTDTLSHFISNAASALILVPEAKLAWQEKIDTIMVYVNGEALCHDRTVLPIMLALCEHWRLESSLLAQAPNGSSSTVLLEQLLERGALELE